MELEPPLLARLDVERGSQPRDDAAGELDERDDEVGCLDPERRTVEAHAIGLQQGPVGEHPARGAEHRRQHGERIDAHVDERTDRVERLRPRVPRLDPAPVRLRICDANGAQRAVAHQLPHGLLRLAEQRRRRATEGAAAGSGELDELLGLLVAERERLLGVDMLSALERRGGHLRVHVRRCEIDHGVDRVVGQELLEGRIAPAAELRDDVRRSRKLESVVCDDPFGVSGRDVPAAHDRGFHASHARSVSRISRQSSLGS